MKSQFLSSPQICLSVTSFLYAQEGTRLLLNMQLLPFSLRILTAIRKNQSNRFCADCDRPDPEWAVVNWGLVVCKDCSGVHRDLGVSYSKVRSLKMDEDIWTEDVVTFMQTFGMRPKLIRLE